MPKVILPSLDTYRLTLEQTRWYILNEVKPRLVLALGRHPSMPESAGGYWIYDPAKHLFETLPDHPQLAWEVDVEIKGL